ncbi:MAG: 3-keto-disaccharide hydrolase [Agriterribacter sp.]
MKPAIALSALWMLCFPTVAHAQQKWISLFNGKDLTGWTARGNARWSVKEGVITGQNGQGHLYAAPVVKDFEVKGEFRIIDQGKGANSGFYVRAHEPEDDPEGFPRGYEAQICNNTEAFTGWLWKPGKPTGKATALLTKDGEWFPMRVKVKGDSIFIWVKDQLVMTYRDQEYKEGKFVIQCHNPGMTAEARNLYYRKLD